MPNDNASAPYNFIPLPPKAVEAPLCKQEGDDAVNKYIAFMSGGEKLSGVIDLDITTKTPCFIGGFGEEFFAPAGKYLIPGSTVRGMVKNLMKIVTCGAMRPSGRKSVDSDEVEGDGDFFDRHLFFRTMADKIPLVRKAYTKEMVTMPPKGSNEKPHSNALAGFLIRYREETGETRYAMCPADFFTKLDIATIKQYEVPNSRNNDSESGKPKDGNPGDCVQWDWPINDGTGVACFVGEMNTGKKKWDPKLRKEKFVGKAHYTVHHSPVWDKKKRIPVPDEVIMAYQDDATRDGVNVLHDEMGKRGTAAKHFTGCDDVDFVVPCFYVADKGKVKHFGFGRYYRIPYKYSIGDHIPEDLQKKDEPDFVDFTDAIFGHKEHWGSRVFFDDCICEGKQPALLDKDYTHVLSSPNPTSFQLYLKQNEDDLQHWNSASATGEEERKIPVSIRGYKLYWHRENRRDSWQTRTGEPVLEGAPKIAPVPVGTKFQGRIRFEQLDAIELGALLKVFALAEENQDKDVCFKLGCGKSLGMGSVKIGTELRLIKEDAYTRLFADDEWNKGETDKQSISAYTKKFDEYMSGELLEDKQDYQQMLEVLCQMLDWKNTAIPGWDDETAAMESEVAQRDRDAAEVDQRYKERAILPTPETVISRAQASS